MTVVQSPITPWWATTQLTSPELRWALSAAFASGPSAGITPEGGVLPGGGAANTAFVPTSNGTSSAPSVSVAPGQLVAVRPTGGTYICTLAAAVTVALDLALPASGQSRIDLLVGEVLDPEADSGATSGTFFQLRTIRGTASASPTAPGVQNTGQVPLFTWQVSNAGAITNITSVRPFTRAPGGLRLVDPGDTRNGSYPGDVRIFATGQVDAWLFSNNSWAWLTIVAPAVWTEVAVDYSYAGGNGLNPGTVSFGTNGTSKCRYKRTGNDLTISYEAIWGTPGTGSSGAGQITTVLPKGWTTPTGRDQWVPCHLWVNDVGYSNFAGDMPGLALIQAGSNKVQPYFPRDGGFCWNYPFRVALTSGVAGQSIPQVGGGYARGGRIHIGPSTIELAP